MFLFILLSSEICRGQLERFAKGIRQRNLGNESMDKFQIPILSLSFQTQIENLVKLAHLKLEESKTLYSSAENLLLSALGLEDFERKKVETNYNIKSFKDSFLTSGRLDAEYYQPKYEGLEKLCFENADYVQRIKNIQIYNARGLQPEYMENGDLDVVNSRHILEKELDYKGFEKTSIEHWDFQAKARIHRGDILTYTTGANIGRTQVYLMDKKALASNHVNILRIKNENSVYVAFVMNSKIGRLQTEQLSAGSAQQELYPKDIDNFYIPFVNKALQTQISLQVQESFRLRAKSDRLLALAKEAVEMAIEKGETEAEKLLL